jgi:hypothetical protein
MPRWSTTCGGLADWSSVGMLERSINAPPQAGHQSAATFKLSSAWQWLQIRSMFLGYPRRNPKDEKIPERVL